MAEYSMTYREVWEFINNSVGEAENADKLREHCPEIMSAITAKEEDGYELSKSLENSLELWGNQIGEPSELLFGTHYIVIKDSVLIFVEAFLNSGMADFLIEKKKDSSISLGFAAVSSAVFGMISLFNSVKELDDYDFCIYMQAVTHYKKHKKFTKAPIVLFGGL